MNSSVRTIENSIIVFSILLICLSYFVGELYWLGLALPIIIFFFVKFDKNQLVLMSVVVLLLTVGMVSNVLFSLNQDSIPYWFAHVLSVILAFRVACITGISKLMASLPLLVLEMIYLIKIFLGIPPSEWLEVNSENFVFVSLLIALSFYVVAFRGKEYSFFLFFQLLIITYISLNAGGRSGILISGLLLLSFIYCYLYRVWNISIVLLAVFSVAIGLGGIYSINFESILSIDYLARFSERGLQSNARFIILSEYIDQLVVFGDYLFGVPSTGIFSISRYGFNLHNSYLTLHSQLGILVVFMFLFLIVALFVKGLLELNFYIIVVLLLCLRATVDSYIFSGRADWVMYTFIFLFIKIKRVDNELHANN